MQSAACPPMHVGSDCEGMQRSTHNMFAGGPDCEKLAAIPACSAATCCIKCNSCEQLQRQILLNNCLHAICMPYGAVQSAGWCSPSPSYCRRCLQRCRVFMYTSHSTRHLCAISLQVRSAAQHSSRLVSRCCLAALLQMTPTGMDAQQAEQESRARWHQPNQLHVVLASARQPEHTEIECVKADPTCVNVP